MENENLEDLKKKYIELGEKIEQLENSLNNLDKDESDRIAIYSFIDSAGSIHSSCDTDADADIIRYQIGNYFENEEEACKAFEKMINYYKLKRIAKRLNKNRKIDWKNNRQFKYYLVYDFDKLDFITAIAIQNRDLGQIYCLDSDFLSEALKEMTKEELKELFENE